MQPKRKKQKIRAKRESIAIVSPLVTPVEAATVLLCDPRTIISMIQSGQLHGKKIGGRYKVSRSSLDVLVRHIQGGSSPAVLQQGAGASPSDHAA